MLVRNTKELGHMVRDARRRHSLTQAELAIRAGVSRKWVIDLEGGKRSSELGLVMRALNVLELELDVRSRGKRAKPQIDINDVLRTAQRDR